MSEGIIPALFALLTSVIPLGLICVFSVVGILITVGSLLFVFKMLKNAKGPQIANGRSAPAVVLGVQDTGVTLNESPQVRVTLQVHPPDRAPYEAATSFFISRVQVGMLQQGAIAHVRYDPANPAVVAMVSPLGAVEAYAPPGHSAPPPLPPLLQRLIESQERTSALKSAPERRGTIRTVEELGLYCAGRNPFLALDVEVRPDGGAPYTARVEGVISQLSVDKYRVGQEVIVRADPANPANVTLERSA